LLHSGGRLEPRVFEIYFTRTVPNLIQRSVSYRAIQIRNRRSFNLQSSAQHPLEHLMQRIFRGCKGRNNGTGACKQASAVLFVKLPDFIAIVPATHSSSSISPPWTRHRRTANLSSAGIGDCYTARSDPKNSNLASRNPGTVFAGHGGYPPDPGTDRCVLRGPVVTNRVGWSSPNHFEPCLSSGRELE